jgi:hypothetical protein
MIVVAAYHIFVCMLFLVQGGMWTAVHIPPCFTATFIPYSAKQQRSETLPATSTGHYTICCKNLSLALLKIGKRLPETCSADLGDQ